VFEPPPELLSLDLPRLEELRTALSVLPRPERPLGGSVRRSTAHARHHGSQRG
jgi:hypothetical protein